MHIPFDTMPDHARVWIYQANRALTDHEIQQAEQWGKQFVEQWAAHGQELRALVTVLRHHFLVIALDEQHHAASGCSIDSSVGFVRALEEAFSKAGQPVSFLDRTLVALLYDDEVHLVPLTDIKSHITEGRIAADTLMFNNLVSTKGNLKEQWIVPAQDSWLARYFPKVQV